MTEPTPLTTDEQDALWQAAQALTAAPLAARVAWVAQLGLRERAQFAAWRQGPDALWMGGIEWVPMLLAREQYTDLTNNAGS